MCSEFAHHRKIINHQPNLNVNKKVHKGNPNLEKISLYTDFKMRFMKLSIKILQIFFHGKVAYTFETALRQLN